MVYAKICVNCMREKPNVGGICPYCGFDSARYHPPAHHLPLYATLCGGRYIMGRAIGSGGFGITYIAFDTRLDIPVAIKELFVSGKVKRERGRVVVTDTSGGEVRQYEEIKKRFMQEAMVLAEMETIEGLVKIKDYFQENDTAYIVMEYLDGKTMKDIFKKTNRRMSMDETIRVLTPIMDALTRLHKKGIIHRDVSLDNIMILRDNRIKLIDLGGGKRQGEGGGNTVAIKKSSYTPVEQILGRSSEIGPQTDVYALAVTIYRCICGKFPKPAGERESDNDIERPSKLGVKISKKQEATLLKALAIDPRKRIQTVPELYEGLMNAKKVSIIPFIIVGALVVTGVAVTAATLHFLGPEYEEENELTPTPTETLYRLPTPTPTGGGSGDDESSGETSIVIKPGDGDNSDGTAGEESVISRPGPEAVIEEGKYYLVSEAMEGKVLHVMDNSYQQNAKLDLQEKSDDRFQVFEIKSGEQGYAVMAYTGFAVSILDASAASGAYLCQRQYVASEDQFWVFEDAGNGEYYIRSGFDTYIDSKQVFEEAEDGSVGGLKVIMATEDSERAPYQKWKLVKAD